MKLIKLISIVGIFLLTTGFSKFENFYKNPNSGRVGLEFYKGQYGEYIHNGVLINPVLRSDDTPLTQWFQWGLHNAYETKDINLYSILRDVTTDIEIDIHSSGVLGGNNQRDWRVKHKSSSSYSNCRLHNSRYNTANLSDCLATIREFHNDYPNHHLITLRLELKDNALTSDWYHSPAALDALITAELGDFLYKPSDLKGNFRTLRDAAKNGWPTLGQLTGKIMVVLFDPLAENRELNDYIVASGDQAKAFVSPRVHSRSSADSVDAPRYFKDSSKNHVVMYCLYADNYEVHSHGPNIQSLGRLSSTYKVQASNTPGVSEYRDFLIQRGRGDGSSGDRNPNWAYSGRLKQQYFTQTELPPVVSLRTAQYCLNIENNSTSNKADVAYTYCNSNSASQKFAFIDAAIDYDANDFPLSRGYIIQAINTDADGDANQKILEVQGGCCGNTETGREVFQYSRESTSSNNRSEDQYWQIKSLSGGIQIQNVNSQKCLSANAGAAKMAWCGNTTTGEFFVPFAP
ncbi:MAG: hypothetical protein ACI8WB_003150 [Phenylobacterium sp.]|jgi:hypothetical protein